MLKESKDDQDIQMGSNIPHVLSCDGAMDGGTIKNDLLIRGFLCLFLGLMLCVAVACLRYNLKQFRQPYLYIAAGALAILCPAVSCTVRSGDKRKEWALLFAVIVTGIFARWAAYLILRTEQISDFAGPANFYAYYRQRGPYTEIVPWPQRDFFQYNYSLLPAWFPYTRLVMIIFDIFGEDIRHVLAMNMLLMGLSAILIYALIPQKKVALTAAAMFALLPSMVTYSCIATPDHVTIFLILLAVFLWMKAEKVRSEKVRSDQPGNKKALLIFAGASVCCALVNWFKQLSVLVIIAFICYEAAVHLYPAIREKMPVKQLWTKVLSFELAAFLVLVVCTVGAQTVLKVRIETMMKTELLDNMSWYLLLGHSANENGSIDMNVGYKIYDELVEEAGGDYALALEKTMPIAKEMVRENASLHFYWTKIASTFSSEYGFFSFANTSSDAEYQQMMTSVLQDPALSLMSACMIILYLLDILWAVFMLFSKQVDRAELLLAIIAFGYILVLTFGAVQSRYKSLILPVFCLLAARTIWTAVEGIQARFGKDRS